MTRYRIGLLVAAACFLAAVILWQWGGMSGVGPLLILGFLLLAYGIRGYELVRGFTYTVIIFAAVTAALFYPETFTQVGTFRTSRLILPLLMIIMFGMGTALSWKDFRGVISMPRAVVIGVACQFCIMPFVGFGLTKLFAFPPEIAAGIILVGCCPSGLASNVMAYLAKANLALSVSLTIVATLVAPLMTPLLMRELAQQYVPIDFWSMLWDITKLVILPVLTGLLFNHFLHGKVGWLDRAMPLVSMAGIAIIIVVITAAGRDDLLSIGPLLILAVLLHNLSGYCFGYGAARALRLPEQDCRTVALEVGLQNGGLASGLALTMGKLATVGLAPAVFGPVMNITGSSLATWWGQSYSTKQSNV
ncbi:bile acid:sodium symporter family protein [Neolewinella sp.]|uniref:bile acid:sodium symporter family protein n=1 Tax=Neolewinella sp. TaxID=2993543 RepID=UPI003B5276DD